MQAVLRTSTHGSYTCMYIRITGGLWKISLLQRPGFERQDPDNPGIPWSPGTTVVSSVSRLPHARGCPTLACRWKSENLLDSHFSANGVSDHPVQDGAASHNDSAQPRWFGEEGCKETQTGTCVFSALLGRNGKKSRQRLRLQNPTRSQASEANLPHAPPKEDYCVYTAWTGSVFWSSASRIWGSSKITFKEPAHSKLGINGGSYLLYNHHAQLSMTSFW